MSESPHSAPSYDAASTDCTWQIRVRGRLAVDWADWFGGLSLSHAQDHTLLHGPLADQAALYGVLLRVRDLGLELVGVACQDGG